MSESRKQPVLIFHDSLRSPCPIQQLFEVELYCRVLEGRLVLRERAANVSWLAGEAVLYLDNGQDVFVRLMEGGDHLLAGDHHGICAVDTTLDLEEAQVLRLRVEGGNVIADLLGRDVSRHVAECPLRRHDGVHGRKLRPEEHPPESSH